MRKILLLRLAIAPPSNIQTSNVSHDGFTVSWEPSQSTLYTPFYDVIAMPNAVHAPEELSPSQKRTYDTSFTIDRKSYTEISFY